MKYFLNIILLILLFACIAPAQEKIELKNEIIEIQAKRILLLKKSFIIKQ